MHPFPSIFCEVVLSDARESKKRVKKGVVKKFFSEIVFFLVRKGSYTTFNRVKIRKIWEKKGKIRKTRSTTKKRSSEISTVKMEIFSEKNIIQKSWSVKILCVLPNSKPGLRRWFFYNTRRMHWCKVFTLINIPSKPMEVAG